LAGQAKGDIQITGIDASKKLIDVAQKKNKPFSDCIRFLLGDASRLNQLSSISFDVVVCNMALMFIKRFEETILPDRRFHPKSIKSRKIVGKVYNSPHRHIP